MVFYNEEISSFKGFGVSGPLECPDVWAGNEVLSFNSKDGDLKQIVRYIILSYS